MTKILVTGKTGQLGWELQRALAPLGEVIALDVNDMDLAKPDSVRRTVRDIKPAILVNSAAYTAVDKAESEPDVAMQVNGVAPGIMAEEARRLGALMVHYSTDYVFDGTKNDPYVEDDEPNPLNAYGRSKLAGDEAIRACGGPYLIFRTSWLYAARGRNFVRTILRLSRERTELRIVNDQVGAPTWARSVADLTAQVLAAIDGPDKAGDRSGLYHLTGSGAVSWFGFAKSIVSEAATRFPGFRTPALIPITTAEYPLPARRPANSRLSNGKLTAAFGLTPPPWDAMLAQCMREMPNAD